MDFRMSNGGWFSQWGRILWPCFVINYTVVMIALIRFGGKESDFDDIMSYNSKYRN